MCFISLHIYADIQMPKDVGTYIEKLLQVSNLLDRFQESRIRDHFRDTEILIVFNHHGFMY